jgi:hypothetical protein
LLWNTLYTSSGGEEYNFGIAAGDIGTAYVVGSTTGDLFGPNAGGYDSFIFKIAEVPEPSTISMLALGVLGITVQAARFHYTNRQLRLSRHNA